MLQAESVSWACKSPTRIGYFRQKLTLIEYICLSVFLSEGRKEGHFPSCLERLNAFFDSVRGTTYLCRLFEHPHTITRRRRRIYNRRLRIDSGGAVGRSVGRHQGFLPITQTTRRSSCLNGAVGSRLLSSSSRGRPRTKVFMCAAPFWNDDWRNSDCERYFCTPCWARNRRRHRNRHYPLVAWIYIGWNV